MPFSIRRCWPLLLALWTSVAWAAEDAGLAQPIFATGVPHATQDKPQSKLWQARGRTWAWLPVRGGSTILERTPAGWRELTHLRKFLADLPGQADVWADADSVRAVLVGGDRLAVVELTFDPAQATYAPGKLRAEFSLPPLADPPDKLETATIARDAHGRWWIAYDRNRSVFVQWTTDDAGREWSAPLLLGDETHADDIAALFALPDRVGVLWSDQVADAVYFHEHLHDHPPERWSDRIVVEQGNKTADDHLNGVVAGDGTLYVATKNSVDKVGAPQQVLRIRRPDGRWENHPYVPLQDKLGPSRPIVLLAGDRLHLLHTNYDRRDPAGRKDFIAALNTDRRRLDLGGPETRLLSAAKPVNNVTAAKAPPAPDLPFVVLASDADGNVYEAMLPPASAP